jgi:hypothetical protein
LIVLATILHLALPPFWILAMGRFAPRRGLAWTAVAGLALYGSSLLFFGLLLGYLGLLHAPGPLVFWTIGVSVLLVFAVKGIGPIARTARATLSGIRLRPVDVLLGLAAAMMAYLIGLQIRKDWTVGTTEFDSLAYHIPRALVWFWHGDFRPSLTPNWHQIGLPFGGDILLLPGVFLGIGWLGGAWTTAWLSLGAAVAVYAATRSLGAGPRPSVVAALTFLWFPAVGLRLADVNSDIAAAFPLLAAWVLVVRAGSLAEAAFLFPALSAVGVASKANVAPAVLVLTIALFGRRLRAAISDRRTLTAAVAGTLVAGVICIGSYLPVYRLFGDLVGGQEGRIHASFGQGPVGVARAAVFGTLHWLIEPFAFVPEPPRFDVLDRLGVNHAYHALGAGTRERWYPAIDPSTNMSGAIPLLGIPWLLAVLPRRPRISGGLLFLALLLATFAPVNPNCYASRFAVVLLAAFAVLWGLRAGRSPWLVVALLLGSLVVDAVYLRPRVLQELQSARAPDRNTRIAAAIGSHTLWLLNGSLGADASIAGRRADVRFEYVTCPTDGDWVRRLGEIRGVSPWLLLNSNSPEIGTGPAFGRPCLPMLVSDLQQALAAAGWHLAFEENGYQIWSGEERATEKGNQAVGARIALPAGRLTSLGNVIEAALI